MIEVELPNGDIVEFPDGTSRDVMQKAIAGHQGIKTNDGEPGWLYQNVIGHGAVDTPGERLGELIRGAGAATARGIADVPAMPANIAQIGAKGVEKALGMEKPSAVSRALDKLPDTRGLLAKVPIIGPESQYVAPGKAGEFVATAGEFAGGAGAAAGPKALIRYGAIPGLVSEGAGQAAREFMPEAEPYARAAAAIGASLAATPKPTRYGKGVLKADDEAVDAANYLAARGVKPTAGQVADSSGLMKMEGSLNATKSQQEAFTQAALRTAGNATAKRATPKVLRQTQDDLTDGMNRILNFDAPIPQNVGQKAMTVADDYFTGTAGRDLPVALRKVSEELIDVASNPQTVLIPAKTLRKWRTELGRYTTSPQEMTKDAAHALREVIDDITESALVKAGRTDDIAALADLRTKYRNFLAVADASSRGGREGARGLISPERLDTASKRVMGRLNTAVGKGTEVPELSRKGISTIGAAPTVSAGGVRDVLTPVTASLGMGGAGVAGGLAMSNPLAAASLGTAGLLAPIIGRKAVNSGLIQSILMDAGNLAKPAAGVAPGLLGYLSQN